MILSWSCYDLAMILTSVPCIVISRDLDKGTMVNHDLARLTMILASVACLRSLGKYESRKNRSRKKTSPLWKLLHLNIPAPWQIFVCKGNFHGWGTFSEESSFQKLLQNDEDYDCRQIQEIYMPKSFDVLPSEQCVNAPHNCEYYPVGYNLAVGKLEHLFSRTDAAKFCNKKQYAER